MSVCECVCVCVCVYMKVVCVCVCVCVCECMYLRRVRAVAWPCVENEVSTPAASAWW